MRIERKSFEALEGRLGTQAQVAKAIGVSLRSYQRYRQSGQTPDPVGLLIVRTLEDLRARPAAGDSQGRSAQAAA